jgi:hypothetical protein
MPYGQAKNHGWFQVFDASMVQSILDVFNPSQKEIEYFGYDKSGWAYATASSLSKGTYFDIHSKKRFDSDFAAGSRGIACIRMVV